MGLLSAGRVQAARKQLFAIGRMTRRTWPGRWRAPMIRTSSPPYKGPTLQPDVAEATRWYRAWYTAAIRQGLVTEGVSLERIIGAMR